MASREIVEYIKQEMRAGHAPAQIKQALIDVGWSQSEVESAIQEVGVPEETSPVPQTQFVPAYTVASSPQMPSTLDRNLASRTGIEQPATPEMPRTQMSVPENIPVEPTVGTIPSAPQSVATPSRLAGQSTGTTMGDFTGGPAIESPTMVVPRSTIAPAVSQPGKAGKMSYLLIGFLLGVLITLFILGGYIYFTATA
ncbi:MAG: hypothetical protein Q8P93_03585 [bacterium]|nr:hypothetical protein [bacterium]